MSLLYHSIGYHKGWNISFNERFKIFQIIDFEQVDELIDGKKAFVGFASMYLERFDEENAYLRRCNRESKSHDEIDKELYAELVKLDTRLGTKVSKQLYKCLEYTTRLDIIKV